MKRFVLVCVMGFLSLTAWAQNWTLDGSVGFAFDGDFSFNTAFKIGRYINDKVNLGISANLGYMRNPIKAGVYVKYDFYEFEKIYFALTGGIYYYLYFYDNISSISGSDSGSGYYSNNPFYERNPSSAIGITCEPNIAYRINQHIDMYWQFGQLGFWYKWYSGILFGINGFNTIPSFGLIFKF